MRTLSQKIQQCVLFSPKERVVILGELEHLDSEQVQKLDELLSTWEVVVKQRTASYLKVHGKEYLQELRSLVLDGQQRIDADQLKHFEQEFTQ